MQTTEREEKRTSPRRLKYPKYYQDTKRLSITIIRKQYEKLVKSAKLYEKRPATFSRDVIVSFLEQDQLLPKEIAEELSRLKVLGGRYGNLLNQIAERMNSSQKRLFFEPLEAKKIVEKFVRELERVIKTLKNGISLPQQKEP